MDLSYPPDTGNVSAAELSLSCHCLSLTLMTSHSLCATLPLKELRSSYSCILCILNAFISFFFPVGDVANVQNAASHHVSSAAAQPAADPLLYYHFLSSASFRAMCSPLFQSNKNFMGIIHKLSCKSKKPGTHHSESLLSVNVLRETVMLTVTLGLYCFLQI